MLAHTYAPFYTIRQYVQYAILAVYSLIYELMILYYKPTCPFCMKVLDFASKHNITFDLRDIIADEKNADALVARGGKRQVPYLIDEENNTEMYGSDDIIAHLTAFHVD